MKIKYFIILVLIFVSDISIAGDPENCRYLKEVVSRYTKYDLKYYFNKLALNDSICIIRNRNDSNEIWLTDTYSCSAYGLKVEKTLATKLIKLTFSKPNKESIEFQIDPITNGLSIIIENLKTFDLTYKDSTGYSFFYCDKQKCQPCQYQVLNLSGELVYSSSYIHYKCISNNLDSLMNIYQSVEFFRKYNILKDGEETFFEKGVPNYTTKYHNGVFIGRN